MLEKYKLMLPFAHILIHTSACHSLEQDCYHSTILG